MFAKKIVTSFITCSCTINLNLDSSHVYPVFIIFILMHAYGSLSFFLVSFLFFWCSDPTVRLVFPWKLRRMFMHINPGWLLISYCSGRAGREGPGKCFRLYPEGEFEKLEDSTKPEIKRCNLSNVILQLKALGVDDILGFDFMEKPSR